jgi:hypothetical protein
MHSHIAITATTCFRLPHTPIHRSKTIQNLPPVIFSLMKSTEPWSDEYYSFDLEEGMRAAGFQDVLTTEADHRHRVVCGVAGPCRA